MNVAPNNRAWQLFGAAAVVTAGLGFFAGTRRPEVASPSAALAPSADVRRAPSYRELRQRGVGPNAGMYEGQVAGLASNPDLFAAVVQTEQQRMAALADRAERRAYDGAPPVIPHAVDQRAFPDCLSCHDHGATVAGKVAPRISHERYSSCTQCHVVSSTPIPAGTDEDVSSTFEGLASPERGERAWQGAPPTIPHPTRMRSDCASCHGTSGRFGMRSTHPWRQSCTQCHAPSAELDGTPAADAPSNLGQP